MIVKDVIINIGSPNVIMRDRIDESIDDNLVNPKVEKKLNPIPKNSISI